MNRGDILERLKKLNIGYKVGLAGSFSRGDEKSKSDIDVVVDTDILSLEEIDYIENFMSVFGRGVDVVQLRLLKTEDEELDNLLMSCGLEVNEFSAYKSIAKEVIWCE